MQHNKGFSLVELIIVIAIIAVLSAALAPALVKYIRKTQKTYDLDTAGTMGRITQTLIAESDSYSSEGTSAGNSPYDSFYANSTVTASCNTGAGAYNLVVVCDTQDNGRGNNSLEVHPVTTDAQIFANALNTQLGSDFRVRYQRPNNGGAVMTTYIIGYPSSDPNQIEVWIGPNASTPTYMLFPNPDPSYQ